MVASCLKADLMKNNNIKRTLTLKHPEPMWKRVPVRDEHGRPYSDFIMLIPKLHNSSHTVVQKTIDEIQNVLKQYENIVVFADLNLTRNILWISVKAIPGICRELPAAIHARVPNARMVANYF